MAVTIRMFLLKKSTGVLLMIVRAKTEQTLNHVVPRGQERRKGTVVKGP